MLRYLILVVMPILLNFKINEFHNKINFHQSTEWFRANITILDGGIIFFEVINNQYYQNKNI